MNRYLQEKCSNIPAFYIMQRALLLWMFCFFSAAQIYWQWTRNCLSLRAMCETQCSRSLCHELLAVSCWVQLSLAYTFTSVSLYNFNYPSEYFCFFIFAFLWLFFMGLMFLFVQNDLLFFSGYEQTLTQTILNCPGQFCQLVIIRRCCALLLVASVRNH